jgi:NAD(P)-dependent dehydrogenase (short-subunit alcohol dehydrogenase family)
METVMKRFEGKTILVTGGNSGMGFATAKRIVEEGGRVIITGRDKTTLEQAQKELGTKGEAIQADVSRLGDLDRLYAHIKEKYGKIDGLFANAGVAEFTPISAVTEEEFDRQFNINVKGVFFTLQKAIPLLNSGASVLLNASVTGSRGGDSSSVYSATKAAVRSMARTFAREHIAQGLRFNAISPGPIDTPIWNGGIAREHITARKEMVAQANPLKRYGTVDEITSAIVFLLSPESTYILGAELFVDGGMNQL